MKKLMKNKTNLNEIKTNFFICFIMINFYIMEKLVFGIENNIIII